ncbi:hypothetical protein, partial [Neobacillus vireti]|uniref:hypothetical protein n=1 Tax=Neobacillus vireti TaxID=220686 RepID=UPI003000553B
MEDWLFGQSHNYWVRPCPKFTRLRTPPCFFSFTLSEVRPTSDTTMLFKLHFVRSPLNIGHHHAILALLCPKFARLR